MSDEVRQMVQLKLDQVFKLGDFLSKYEERLKTEGTPHRVVAEWAAKELGFPVTGNNVKSIAEARCVRWDVRQDRPGNTNRPMTLRKIEAIEQRLEATDLEITRVYREFTKEIQDANQLVNEALAELSRQRQAIESLEAQVAVIRGFLATVGQKFGLKAPADFATSQSRTVQAAPHPRNGSKP